MDSTWTLVIVGCGGTLWCATPYLSALIRRFGFKKVILIDPDVLTAENLGRQWCNFGDSVGSSKVQLAATALGCSNATLVQSTFWEATRKVTTKGTKTLFLVCTDNNESRLEVSNYVMTFGGAIVLCGCDGGGGQAYWGANTELLHYDLVGHHPDLKDGGGEPRTEAGCGGQTTYANAITGQLLCMCIEDLADILRDPYVGAREFWWEKNKVGRFRAWQVHLSMPRSARLNPDLLAAFLERKREAGQEDGGPIVITPEMLPPPVGPRTVAPPMEVGVDARTPPPDPPDDDEEDAEVYENEDEEDTEDEEV